jgi:PAS domain S-box-containing protein
MGRTEPREADLKRLFALAPSLLCVAGLDGFFKRVNPAFEAILGWSAAELLARPFLDFVHPDDRAATQAVVGDLARGAPTIDFENRYRCRDGSFRWVLWTAVPYLPEGLIYACGHDVTAAKQAEQALRASESRYRQLLESSPDAMVICDQQGRIALVNAAAVQLFGSRREELVGQEIESLIPERFRAAHRAHRARFNAAPHVRPMGHLLKLCGLRRDGSEFPADISLGYLHTEEGLLIFAAVRDVTERDRVAQAMREHELQLLIAQRIQQRLLPGTAPQVAGFDIAGAIYPADFAAGDYYDYLAMPGGRWGIVVGDVSGHGFGPALLTASGQTLIRLRAETTADPGEILTAANAYLAEETDDGVFMTMLLACLDPVARTLAFSNAGHPPGYVFDAAGRLRHTLDSGGMPLAVLPATEYHTAGPVPLLSGDLVVLLTDGVTETLSLQGEIFCAERLTAAVQRLRGQSAQGVVDGLRATVREFGNGAAPADDLTLVAIRVL